MWEGRSSIISHVRPRAQRNSKCPNTLLLLFRARDGVRNFARELSAEIRQARICRSPGNTASGNTCVSSVFHVKEIADLREKGVAYVPVGYNCRRNLRRARQNVIEILPAIRHPSQPRATRGNLE